MMKTLLLVGAAGGAIWYFTRGKGSTAAQQTKTGTVSVTGGNPPSGIPGGLTPPLYSSSPSLDPKDYEMKPTGNYIRTGCASC